VRLVAAALAKRASALIAAAVHALWEVRADAEANNGGQNAKFPSVVACNGSVIQNYPGFKGNCQGYIDTLVEMSGGERGSLDLVTAVESSLLGAAVAVACVEAE